MRTLIGTVLADLFEVLPETCSVAIYRDGESRNGKRFSVDGRVSASDSGNGLLVTPTLLGLANWQEGGSSHGPDSVMVRYGRVYQLMLPVRGGHLSLGFEVHAHPATEIRRVIDVLNRHGLHTLWLVL